MKEHKNYYPDISYVNKIHCKTISLDNFFSSNNIEHKKYNFLNIDVQGAEMLVLKGCIETLKYIDAIYIEVNFKEIYENNSYKKDVDIFLNSYGFELCNIVDSGYGWGDALYIKTEKKKKKNSI